ncbi:TPA: hypothetical protein ACOQ31_005609 [Bacillus cereus]|uniref:hypothetical protein n=1 Tax=Bacillus cereus group TaxID=86661 RepID=UPI0019295DE8|nr:hypothetical protein [Bacillus cereus]MBL3768501.1 hypothetical protein [Bacillus cereus]MBL3774484.1 hypothetical protein [Bacillus cereus]MBL3780298.1 hypothetical protein [Bacillus cereus]MBL3791485.1 hypothetical protein [Bacillus cereus]MBL3881094.1 hypothetical protein [Bacillus cereus]
MSAIRQASSDKETKILKSGNVTITIHSNLVNMSSEERKYWFQKEQENKNPVLMKLNEVIHKINMELSTN